MILPTFETVRLRIRPFRLDELDAVCRVFGPGVGESERREWERWLQWSDLNHGELARLHQPPYGDRAIELRQSGELIGSVGLVPLLMPFGQIPGLTELAAPGNGLSTAEVGLFWHVAEAHRGCGYAPEAAAALIDFAFREFRLARILATTSYDNAASMRVMEKLGMRLERNPLPEPPWLQVVAILANALDSGTPPK
jgi:[ribosomal protein S5]-alanine N-acetyltransferase